MGGEQAVLCAQVITTKNEKDTRPRPRQNGQGNCQLNEQNHFDQNRK